MEPWALMWLLSISIYLSFKMLTWIDGGCPQGYRGIIYLVAWPGMDARTFCYAAVTNPPTKWEWIVAIQKTVVGCIVYFVGPRFFADYYVIGWVGMTGIVLTVHCGLFHVLSCLWRSVGFEARPLMNHPLLCTSLSDFWGKRWNTAFHALTYRFLFRPIYRKTSSITLAVLGSFLFSGILHDIVISLPAGGGYGMPTLYFLIQGWGVLLEGPFRKVRLGWLHAFFFVLVAAPLLFHPLFIEKVMLPFMITTGAIR